MRCTCFRVLALIALSSLSFFSQIATSSDHSYFCEMRTWGGSTQACAATKKEAIREIVSICAKKQEVLSSGVAEAKATCMKLLKQVGVDCTKIPGGCGAD